MVRSPNYFARCRVAGDNKWRLRSTGTTVLAEAEHKARDIYWKLKGIKQAGGVLDSVRFAEAARDWLKDFAENTKTKNAHADYTVTVERYLIPYFDGVLGRQIWEVSEHDIKQYRNWRRSYWMTGPGSKLKRVPVLENGKQMYRDGKAVPKQMPKSWKREPTNNTIRNEGRAAEADF